MPIVEIFSCRLVAAPAARTAGPDASAEVQVDLPEPASGLDVGGSGDTEATVHPQPGPPGSVRFDSGPPAGASGRYTLSDGKRGLRFTVRRIPSPRDAVAHDRPG
jgi:hypothetical protein